MLIKFQLQSQTQIQKEIDRQNSLQSSSISIEVLEIDKNLYQL